MKTILRLTVLLALTAGVCFAQGTGSGMIIQTQSAGTTNGTFKKYFVLNCVSGLTCSVSGSTLSMTGGGALPTGLTFSLPTLTVSAAGSGNAILALSGNTSGTATLTAPAIAGTNTNAIVSSNVIVGPAGSSSNVTFGFSDSVGTGIYECFISQICLNNGGRVNERIVNTNHVLGSDIRFGWDNAVGDPNQGLDTAFSRVAAGVVAVGTGAAASRAGFVLSADSVFVASNFTTAANTSLQTITGLSWTVPAAALNYNFHCHGSYSQGTGAAAVAFGIQAATNAPTNIFATGHEQITAGPPSTYVDGVLATLTTTTATNIVSGTPGVQATNYLFDLAGTIENPASANTFNVMVSTATSADAVTVLRGSYCSITP